MPGRTIRIFLTEGTANGIQICEIMNWTGKVLVVPRTGNLITNLMSRPEVKQTGIYILSGTDPDSSFNKEKVYIGQSDNVLQRLDQHLGDSSKDFWERTVIIVSKDSNLTKSHVLYLESKLIAMAMNARRATLANGNNPPPPKLPEADVADMDYFLEQVQMLLPVLGFPFAVPVPTTVESPTYSGKRTTGTNQVQPLSNISDRSPTFIYKTGSANSPIIAHAQEVEGQFVVFKDSQAKSQLGVLSPGYQNQRNQLKTDGKLMNDANNGVWVFTEDVPFSSPSAAAAIIAGYNVNGQIGWKVKDNGQTYRDWQNTLNSSVNTPSADTSSDMDNIQSISNAE